MVIAPPTSDCIKPTNFPGIQGRNVFSSSLPCCSFSPKGPPLGNGPGPFRAGYGEGAPQKNGSSKDVCCVENMKTAWWFGTFGLFSIYWE